MKYSSSQWQLKRKAFKYYLFEHTPAIFWWFVAISLLIMLIVLVLTTPLYFDQMINDVQVLNFKGGAILALISFVMSFVITIGITALCIYCIAVQVIGSQKKHQRRYLQSRKNGLNRLH